MARPKRVFFAYPSQPHDLVGTINLASEMISAVAPHVDLLIWPLMDVFGTVISEKVLDSIDTADVLYCDVTSPNQNVYYEFGYAIGRAKSVGITINSSFEGATRNAQSDGLFDTIGYKTYENSQQLADIIANPPMTILLDLYSKGLNKDQPFFVLDTLKKTDFRNHLVSYVKENRAFYRSFDPVEVPRFSSTAMISELTSSSGIVIPFIAAHIEDAKRHNLRASFLAGLARGLARECLLIEQSHSSGPLPIDFRERVQSVRSWDEIKSLMSAFVARASEMERALSKIALPDRNKSPLQRLSLGASAAENEFRTLQHYFVQTSEYLRCTRGELNVVAGRKGSGKTAIFFQVRDNARKNRNSVVVDLKPESHQLTLFREEMLKVVNSGVFDHTISALWYFLILSEIVFTLKMDKERVQRRTPDIIEKLNRLEAACDRFQIYQSGDFTFRINRLSARLLREIQRMADQKEAITAESITNILFSGGITELRSVIEGATDDNTDIWFLFDNIDKGWPATGLEIFDVRMVRLLVEALTKIGRDFHSVKRRFVPIVFVRNDVLELMVSDSPDRNKWAQVSIDWSDRPKIRQVIFERLRGARPDKSLTFEMLWSRSFCDSVGSRSSFDYFLDHCLMRPRFLINIIEYAISNAINRGNETVTEQDCIDAVKQHSNYLVDDFGYEIRDVSGLSSDILYSLLGVPAMVTKEEVISRFSQFDIGPDRVELAFRMMLWYGIIGIAADGSSGKFVYDFDYNMRRLDAEIKKAGENVLFATNPAVHVALSI